MLDTDWYASDRAVAPPRIEMLSNESRVLNISLSPFLGVSDVVVTGPAPTVKLMHWRNPTVLYPQALDGSATYNASTKVVSQRVDARYFPRATPIAMLVSFQTQVSGIGPVDQRSILLIIVVPV